ncbi:hypothetical protein M413DRAFT_110784 [Hebeloma cylindrosporum]|uniref:Uncharacterized protein n=1 Tax=Hebeloma cylindrosporum TaxID=76867 RepID=A0A0C3CLF6_HEBCY|nr:hypothetical protein M413DRAFT_110784 [Hebeloma cylindrosporum h7]
MSISALPSHILFDIILGVVARYVDTAIASPPAPRWMHRFSKPAIILVRDFLATQVKNGLREPPHVPFASNLTEWSNVTESEFLDILRELVGEEELDSFLLPEIPSNFDFVAWDEEEFEKDQIPDAIVAEDHKPHDELPVPSLESTTENKESANFCEVAEEGDSLVLSDNSLLAEEAKEANELAEDAVDASGGNELQSHSPVPSESLTVLGSPTENTAEIDEISSTADEDASDGEVGSDTDGDWVEEWFQEWFAVEEREPLTKNTIVHLMGVNGAFREATLKAITLTLGIKRGRKKM